MKFKSVSDYLAALSADPSLSIIPVQAAADALGITRQAVERRIKTGELSIVKFDKTKAIRASSIVATVDNWRKDVDTVRTFLIDVAKAGKTVVYGPVMSTIGLKTQSPPDRGTIGKILGEISRQSYAAHGFLLSALVFNKTAGKPSESFYFLGQELHKPYRRGRKADGEFLEQQLDSIHAFYAS